LCTNQLSLYCPSHLHRPHGCNTIALLSHNMQPSSDSPFSRHTTYNIAHYNILLRLSWRVARSRTFGRGLLGRGSLGYPLRYLHVLDPHPFSITRSPLDLGLYTIFVYFKTVVHESIVHVSPPPLHCQHNCNTIARPLCNVRSPPNPPFVCHTSYTIGFGNIL